MITILEREIESGGSGSSSAPNGSASTAKASGVEEHVTNAHARPGHTASTTASGAGEKAKKREYTPKQMEVVKRVKGCKHHEYYEILAGERGFSFARGGGELMQESVERSCEENEVKRAYKKVCARLRTIHVADRFCSSLHWRCIQTRSTRDPTFSASYADFPSGAPGADEAFKSMSIISTSDILSDRSVVVSKAFQVLSDGDLRAAFDSNPNADPPQRNSGMSSRGGGGGMHPGFANGGFQGDINPEDLFNMFFGGGNMGGGFGGGQANGSS